MLFCLGILAFFLPVALCGTGIETTQTLSSSQISCFQNDQNKLGFIMARVWTTQGRPDMNGVKNIKAALNGGLSAFSSFEPCPKCSESPSGQVSDAYGYAQGQDINLGGIFIKVFSSLGGWSSTNTTWNIQYIKQLINGCNTVGSIPVIWSSYNDWKTITGNDKEWANSIRYIVYTHLDGKKNENDWYGGGQQFGGWGLPYMKEYKTLSVCSVNGFGLYAPNVFLRRDQFSVKPVSEEVSSSLVV